ncbi:MAG: hypothetical protein D6729_19570 [Deltaproteobacteria bacterium]|nr:MAG: hypothetical protein D6729_19570 [Deltaproteobacteria bacterium]
MRLRCQACGAGLEVEPELRTATCAFCASPHVIEQPEAAGRPEATFALGFVVDRARAVEIARAWKRGRGLFAPRRYNRADVEEVRGVYVPAYLYSAEAHARYQAEIGEDYRVEVKDREGRRRTERRTEWRTLEGLWAGYVEGRVVTASRGVPNDALEAVEPYDLRALCRYTPKLIAGWLAEEASRSPEEGAELGRREALTEVHRRLARFMPGDRHRGLRSKVVLEREDVELLLLPLWILPIRYHPERGPARILVNGQTGAVWGRVPVSGVKVTLAVLTVLAIAAALFLVWSGTP